MLQTEQRTLGASDIAIPALGIGTWSWGDTAFWQYGQGYTQDDILKAYRACLDAGLNFFDTAEIYGQGASERILGDCMREVGEPIVIATKFAPFPLRLSARTLFQALDDSLERLGVEHIDLYQIHWPYTFIHMNALMDALAEVVRKGKVRAVGVSNYSANQMRKAHARLARHDIPLVSNQVHYSLLHRHPETNGVLTACRELNITLIAYSPLEQGLLTGKYSINAESTPPLRGPRRLTPAFSLRQRRKMEPLLETLAHIAQSHGKTSGQVALNWLTMRDEHVIPIPGAKNVRQAQENAGALGWALTTEEFERIGEAARPWLPR